MSATASARDCAPEITYRTTREGRRLLYQLTVIQQPERARACGSGAKSSADRRPVDPPPVVELRIFEFSGPGGERKDITFSYDANFFLYATLELATPIAHGRNMPPAAQQSPVLTGMPVSGMAYLDRPQEAGYFIFPDLSVRHEGIYKLSFNLYEETKDPKDEDAEPVVSSPQSKTSAVPAGSFDWRLEVKSMPFTVYSAKKFPGLAESTVLSRCVADQGCRVRIRRDVRMRRREVKEATEEPYDMDEELRARSRRTATPADSVHDAHARPRSLSTDRQAIVYSQDRRVSEHYAQGQYPSAYAPSPGAPPLSTQSQQYPPPPPPSQYSHHVPYQQHPQPPPPHQHRYAPPQQSSVPAPNYYQGDQGRSSQSFSNGYSQEPPRAQHEAELRAREAYEKSAYERASLDEYNRRSSMAYNAPAPQYSGYGRSQSIAYPPPQYPTRNSPVNQTPVSLAPIQVKMPPVEPKYENVSPPGPMPAALRTPSSAQMPRLNSYSDRPSTYNNYNASASSSTVPDASRNGKRPFESAFGSTASSHSQPLHNGMRPFEHATSAFDEDDGDDGFDVSNMSYKRADGNMFSRSLPTLQ